MIRSKITEFASPSGKYRVVISNGKLVTFGEPDPGELGWLDELKLTIERHKELFEIPAPPKPLENIILDLREAAVSAAAHRHLNFSFGWVESGPKETGMDRHGSLVFSDYETPKACILFQIAQGTVSLFLRYGDPAALPSELSYTIRTILQGRGISA